MASSDETAITIQSIADSTNEIAAGSEQTLRSMTDAIQKMNSLEEATRYLNNDAQSVKEATDHMIVAAHKGGESVTAFIQCYDEYRRNNGKYNSNCRITWN